MNRNQAGVFYVSSDLVRNNIEDFAKALSIMEFVPFRVEHLYENMTFEYQGVSKFFDHLDEGKRLRKYEVIISKNDDGDISVEVKPLVMLRGTER